MKKFYCDGDKVDKQLKSGGDATLESFEVQGSLEEMDAVIPLLGNDSFAPSLLGNKDEYDEDAEEEDVSVGAGFDALDDTNPCPFRCFICKFRGCDKASLFGKA